jgi:hypothetical protein
MGARQSESDRGLFLADISGISGAPHVAKSHRVTHEWMFHAALTKAIQSRNKP